MPDTSHIHKIIEGCRQNNRKSQKALYETFKAEMFQVCLRYSKNRQIAEDTLQESFLKVFDHIDGFKGEGLLIYWIKRIVINTALMKLRKKHLLVFYDNIEEAEVNQVEVFPDPEYQYSMDQLKKIISEMPEGYKVVFTLYAYDGYSHKDIAAMLNISENTSKSQLSRARNYLRKVLKELKPKQVDEFNAVLKTGLLGGITLALQEIV